jgi:tRNA modification GTPase
LLYTHKAFILAGMNYAANQLGDTIVALATPGGEGAIGVIRLSGKEAIAIVNKVFKGKDLEKAESHSLHFGRIYDDERLLDEVVVGLFIGPRSYTGEHVAEVSCHGSSFIIQELIQLFAREGARLAQPGEFTLRAFLNGRMDLSQAEAVADLIASDSESSHRVALRQMRGGFRDEIQRLRQELIDFASLIELELDFGEEDVEFANRDDLRELVSKIQRLITELLQSFQLGNAIKQGVSTVIAGRPNAGKSTLLNALLNEERAIVSEIAGTTRDTIEEVLNIKGVKFRIIDTAGIRDAQDTIEAIGVEKTLEKIEQSSILLYVFDVVTTQPEELQQDLQRLYRPGLQLLVIANKMDLNPYTKVEHYMGLTVNGQRSTEGEENSEFGISNSETKPSESGIQNPESAPLHPSPFTLHPENWIPISAINKMNLGLLRDKLYEAAVGAELSLDNTIVTNVRHYDALRRASASLDDVLRGMAEGVTSDFVAMDIRQALYHLGEITGEISTDDLLGNIFGKFCIGK